MASIAPARLLWRRLAQSAPVSILAMVCVAGLAVGLGGSVWQAVGPALPDRPDAGSVEGFSGRVVRVIDGDSFRLDCCGPDIRLWAIDAPEWNERGGSAATAALRALVAGRTLTCRERDIDRHGRIVGQCTLPDGNDLGERLLATDTVREYCHFSRNHYRTC